FCAGPIGRMCQRREQSVLVSEPLRLVPIELEQTACAIDWVNDGTSRDGRAYRMQLVFEGGDNSEVSAPAANGPEQVRLLVPAGPQDFAVRSDKVDGSEIVEGETIFAHQPAQPAAKGESGDPRAGDHSARDRQAVQLGLAIELSPGDAGLCMRRATPGVDANALHGTQVDHHATIDGRAARHVVTASANGYFEPEPPRQVDRVDDVGHAAASGNQCRPLVDEPIVDFSRIFVPAIGRLQKLAPEGGSELGGGAGNGRYRHNAPSSASGCHLFHLGLGGANAKNSAKDEPFSSRLAAWRSCRR